MSAFDGKQALVEFSIQPEGFSGSHTWLTLGMMLTKSLNGSWETADTTADSTPDSATTVIATRRSFTFSGDGVSRTESIYNQLALKNHWFAPGSTTQNMPKIWVRLSYPTGEKFTGPFMLTSFNADSPEKDKATWSIEATSNGTVVYDDGVA